MNESQRGSWYLLTGVILGLLLGLFYSGRIQPVRFIDASPAALSKEHQDEYRVMIAMAFVANGDPVRAKARLELIGDGDIYQVLSEQAQRTLSQDNHSEEARALGVLAIELGKTRDPVDSELFNDLISTPEFLVTNPSPPGNETGQGPIASTSTVIPDASIVLVTPTPVSADLFILQSLEKVCEPRPTQPLFQIEALDKENQPIPGVLIILSSELGEERFYTGLSPDEGVGYAEFRPLPGIFYSLRLEESGIPIQDLTIAECQSSSGEAYSGSWKFIFIKS